MIDKSILTPFLMASLAGLSTLLGVLIVFFMKKSQRKILTFSLGFAAGIMLGISFLEIFPSSIMEFSEIKSEKTAVLLSLIFAIVGMFLGAILDIIVPDQKEVKEKNDKCDMKLYRVGIMSMIALALHNFPEGIASFVSGYKDIAFGLTISIAIALHNIPEGISIAAPIYCSTNSKKKAFWFTFIAAISEPIGALFAILFLKTLASSFVLGAIFSMISGLMIYISLAELLPTAYKYGDNKLALISVLVGICLTPLLMLI